jgi:hypothetical protein
MPFVRADRLPPTASVVDAVFANFDGGEETAMGAWDLPSGARRAIAKTRRRGWTAVPTRPHFFGLYGKDDYEKIYDVGVNIDIVEPDRNGNYHDEDVALFVGAYTVYSAAKLLRDDDFSDYSGVRRRALDELIVRLTVDQEFHRRKAGFKLDLAEAKRAVHDAIRAPNGLSGFRIPVAQAVNYLAALRSNGAPIAGDDDEE